MNFLSPTRVGVGDLCVLFVVSGANLDKVSGVAVDIDVRQLQTDDLTGLGDDESATGQLWLRRHIGEVAISGHHVQTSFKPHTNTHILLNDRRGIHKTLTLRF